jgi:hypothetical protein
MRYAKSTRIQSPEENAEMQLILEFIIPTGSLVLYHLTDQRVLGNTHLSLIHFSLKWMQINKLSFYSILCFAG